MVDCEHIRRLKRSMVLAIVYSVEVVDAIERAADFEEDSIDLGCYGHFLNDDPVTRSPVNHACNGRANKPPRWCVILECDRIRFVLLIVVGNKIVAVGRKFLPQLFGELKVFVCVCA